MSLELITDAYCRWRGTGDVRPGPASSSDSLLWCLFVFYFIFILLHHLIVLILLTEQRPHHHKQVSGKGREKRGEGNEKNNKTYNNIGQCSDNGCNTISVLTS